MDLISDKPDSHPRIEDIGEKFAGARKDGSSPIFNEPIIAVSSKTQITKKQLWPKPDFREHALSGLKAVSHCLLFMLVYDGLSTKPLSNGWFNLSGSVWDEAYTQTIKFLSNEYETNHYDSLEGLIKSFNAFIDDMYVAKGHDSIERYAAGKASRRRVKHPLSLNLNAKTRLSSLAYLGWPQAHVQDTDCYGACQLIDTKSKQKFWYAVKGSGKTLETLDSWSKCEEFSQAMGIAKVKFEQVIAERAVLPTKPKKERSKPPQRPRTNRPFIRKGPDWRGGELITAEVFVAKFKFRGIEFGNWVTQPERQGFLDATYDALMDLTSLFDLPPTFASLGGQLGIAFGSRGTGLDRAAAHFERDQWLIHLTKSQGFGSLSHEFAHALDAYLAKRNALNYHFFTDLAISSSNYRLCLRPNFGSLANLKDVSMLDRLTTLLYAMIHGSEEEYPLYLAGQFIRSVTVYSNNATQMDIRKRKPYWTNPTEIFARAFESWVSDTLMSRGLINEYLVYGTDEPASSWNTSLNMYPEFEERYAIIKSMDMWIKSLVSSWKSASKGKMINTSIRT